MSAAAGVALTSRATGRILLLLRRDGTWGIPGGMLEPGDGGSCLLAARRELREETDYRGALKWQGAIGTVRFPDGLAYTTFRVKVPREFICRFLDGEHTDFTWADPTNPPGNLHRGVSDLLARLS